MYFIPYGKEHAVEAGKLLIKAYQAERAAVPALPDCPGADDFVKMAESLSGNGLGFAVFDEDEMIGFLAGMETGELFGSNRGVYIPLFGHAASGHDRQLVYHLLYEKASEHWVRRGLLSHAITLHAHDDTAVGAWFRQDFGLRCVDAIRPLTSVSSVLDDRFDIRLIQPDDAEALLGIFREHEQYYRSAPMFMPLSADVTVSELRGIIKEKDQFMWAAFDGGVPIAFMRLRHGGESFVSDDDKCMNICGAYVRPDCRHSGLGASLLSTIVQWMQKLGFKRLGVDYESFNIYGSRFWQKHFTPFTYSLTRRVDERILL